MESQGVKQLWKRSYPNKTSAFIDAFFSPTSLKAMEQNVDNRGIDLPHLLVKFGYNWIQTHDPKDASKETLLRAQYQFVQGFQTIGKQSHHFETSVLQSNTTILYRIGEKFNA